MVVILRSEVRQAREGHTRSKAWRAVQADPEWWTFDLVREKLVEASDLWWRSPAVMSSQCYATDAPWHQLVREMRFMDYDARGGDGDDAPIGREPLSVNEVELRDRVSEWLSMVDDAQDRKLIIVAVGYLARGRAQVPWRKIKHQLGIKFGEHGLRKRFDRAVRAITEALNAAEKRG